MYAQTLQNLSDKLQNANKVSLIEKRKQKQAAQIKLMEIESVITEQKRRDNQELDKTKQTIDNVTRLCEETIRNFSIKSEKEAELVNSLRDEVETEIERCQKEHTDKIEDLLEGSEEVIKKRAEEAERRNKVQLEKGESALNELSRRLIGLQKDLKSESDTRKENCHRISSEIQEEIVRFKEGIDKEREKREQSEKKLNDMLEEIEKKISDEIDNQGLKRKKNNESLLKLIEVACNKLEEVL